MVIGYTVTHLYQHPVEKVVEAHLNDLYSHKDKETLNVKEVEHRPDTDGLEYLKRIITSVNTVPSIIRKMGFMNDPEVKTEEEVWMDRPGKRFWFRHFNVSFANSVTIQENSTFVADASNPEWTCFEQAGATDMSNLGFIGKVLEILYKNEMEKNVRQNIRIMEEILERKVL